MKTLTKTQYLLVLGALVYSLSYTKVAAADVITCESDSGAHHYCSANTRGGVTLVHQLSRSGCWKNDTWGYDHRGIWVANGCRAEFRTDYSGSERRASYYHNEDRWDDRDNSDDDAAKVAGAALAIGLIAAAAVAQEHDDDHDQRDNRYQSTYVCESRDERHHYCSLGNRRGNYHVELKRQLSETRCQYLRTWGYDRGGIWVSDGCRAEFWVND